jgi:predicted Zn-dependent protease
LNYLGYMLADRNIRLPEALEMIQKAVNKEPNNGAYLDSLGWVYYRMNRLPEAEENIRRAVDLVPHDPTMHDHFGEVLFKAGKVREAITQWELALKEWDTSSPAEMGSVGSGQDQGQAPERQSQSGASVGGSTSRARQGGSSAVPRP